MKDRKILHILSLLLLAASAGAQIIFEEQMLTEYYDEPWSVRAADMDGDGDMDIVTSSRGTNSIHWWENVDNLYYMPYPVSTSATSVMGIRPADLDGDQDIDVVAALEYGGRVVWYENDGQQQFTYRLLAYWAGASYVEIADVNQDSLPDVLAAACEGTSAKFGWFENLGNGTFTEHLVCDGWNRSNSIAAADIDGDQDIDLLGTASLAGQCAWFENIGDEVFLPHYIYDGWARPSCAQAADLDNDDDIDVVVCICQLNQILIYENDGAQSFTNHVLDNYVYRPHKLYIVDLDDDTDPDILAACIDSDEIAWHENLGNLNFSKHIITSDLDGACGIYAADLDDDDDMDVLGTAQYGDQVCWWENITESAIEFQKGDMIPTGISLSCYPNPFNPVTRIELSVPHATDISLGLYTVSGEKVLHLAAAQYSAGRHEINFDGHGLAAGIYLLYCSDGQTAITRQLLLLK